MSGRPTHWYRYRRLGKVWSAACYQTLTQYEREHVHVRVAAKCRIECEACRAKLDELLADVKWRAEEWEDLFHGFE